MLTFTLFAIVLAAAFLSAESIVTTLAGFVISAVGTQVTKNWLGAAGPGSVLIAISVSIVVAIIGILASGFLGGAGFSLDALVKQSGQIFALSTLAYHVFRPDSAGGN